MLLSGVLWPMEGMSIYLRYLSYFIPLTHAIEALRCIFARGWGIDRPEVYWGIVVNFGWIVGLLLVCLTVIRVRKYTG
jgi:ABC-type multidrug transport system permease subunit